jgi:uncharacterized repeat protein (TIGR03803 family)
MDNGNRVGPLAKPFRIVAIIFLAFAGRAFNANAQTETNLYSFGSSSTDGNGPVAGLVQGSDGNFYGTTQDGGTYSYGTVFRISPGASYTNLYSFGGSPPDGKGPVAGLVQGSDGNFYGTTYFGGLTGVGAVFRISLSGTYTNLYSFGYSPDGFNPFAGLVQGSDGNFYGTTYFGGPHGVGTVYRISLTGAYTNLYSFGSSPLDGDFPVAGLVQGNDGNFYGTTQDGGTYGDGTVFRISLTGAYTNLYSFGSSPTDGNGPVAGLVQGSDDNFYGTTQDGGTYSNGTVYRISLTGAYTNLYSFGSSPAEGNGPVAGLVQGSGGNFYGTTDKGGTNDEGAVFALDVGLGPVTNDCKFSISSYNAAFGAAGGSGSVGVTASDGCAWTAASNDSFIRITSGSSGSGNGTLDYTVAATTSSNDLTGTMTIAGQTFTVTQSGLSACRFALSVTNAPFEAAGGVGSVSVTTSQGCSWTAASNDGFITVISGHSGSGNGAVHYRVAANTSTNGLTGTMTIAGETFTVTQTSASACTYTLSATRFTFPSKGGSKSVSVKVKGADCAWTAVSNDPFITITSGASGTGNGKIDYTVPGNTNTTALSGTMTIAGRTVTVNQDAGGCAFKLSPKEAKLTAAAGNGTVKVAPTLSDCDWTAVSHDSFITITGVASGAGEGTVTYTVPANTSTNELTGSITIGGETFTVTQAAAK